VLQSNDIARLLLRLSVGGLMLFHGIHKLIHGIGSIKAMVHSSGLPEFIAYGVYVGELIAPLFIILGLYARVASLVLSVNMVMAIYLAYGFCIGITKYGGLNIESPLLFLVMSLVVFLLGSGKFAVNSK